MIRLAVALFLLTVSPVFAGQFTPRFEPGLPPSRNVPKDRPADVPAKPVAIVPRNRRFEAIIAMLMDERKTKPSWNRDSGRWFGKDGRKKKSSSRYNRRMTKRSSAKW